MAFIGRLIVLGTGLVTFTNGLHRIEDDLADRLCAAHAGRAGGFRERRGRDQALRSRSGRRSPQSSVAFASVGTWSAVQTSPTNCIGAGCMARRVGQAAIPAHPGDAHHRNDDGGEVYYRAGTERAEVPERGFCGQFGRPA
jgi:hypothetical protein